MAECWTERQIVWRTYPPEVLAAITARKDALKAPGRQPGEEAELPNTERVDLKQRGAAR